MVMKKMSKNGHLLLHMQTLIHVETDTIGFGLVEQTIATIANTVISLTRRIKIEDNFLLEFFMVVMM